MTIRYECAECQSVLKIRDELAGTNGKCPKCKTEFTIPAASKQKTKSRVAVPAGPPEDELDPIDMPREVTPAPDMSSIRDESRGMSGSGPSIDTVPADDAPKPSIAELMREHEEKRKKKKDKKKKGGLAEAAVAAEDLTSGTAADALTRSYDQKRGKAGEPPPLTREERREAENRAAMMEYAKKAVPIGIGLLVTVWLVITIMWAEPVPELGYVHGVVTLNGSPLGGAEVRFSPIIDSNSANADGRKKKENAGMMNSSSGYTDSEGKYVLMYNEDHEGAVPGEHKVEIIASSQAVYRLSSGDETKIVKDGDNTFNFDVQQ